MTLNYQPFKSEFGFASPNFSVDANGNIIANSVLTVGSGSQNINIVLKDSTIDTVDSSAIDFLTSVVNFDGTIKTNNITDRTGTLSVLASETLTLGSPLETNQSRVQISNAVLSLENYTTGERNSILPQLGDMIFNIDSRSLQYYTLDDTSTAIWRNVSTGKITFEGEIISTSGPNTDIQILPQTGGEVVVDTLKINDEPTLGYQATRKTYVDRTAIAYAVALGT